MLISSRLGLTHRERYGYVPTMMAFAPRLSSALFVFITVGCGAANSGLNQTSITCPANRTLLDGVCVSESVADYVACVRAQGASLGGSKHQQISAEVGTVGIKAGGAAEVSESLEKKYATSDAAMLEIVHRCSASVGPATPAPSAVVAGAAGLSGTWRTTVFWDHGNQNAEVAVTFTQKGTHLAGTFFLPNEGHIEGELVGGELRGTWSRPPFSGHIELTFDAAGTTFQGTYGDAPKVFETWKGHRP